MARASVHTVPRKGQWGHRVEGESEFLPQLHRSKDEAEEVGRGLAIARRAEHVVHHVDGSIAYRIDYSGQPSQRPGRVPASV